MRSTLFFIILALAINCGTALAQSSFEKEIDLGYSVSPTSAVQSPDGSCYVHGFFYPDSLSSVNGTADIFILKINEAGDIQWVHQLKLYNILTSILTATSDSSTAIIQLSRSTMNLMTFGHPDSIFTEVGMVADGSNQTSIAGVPTPDGGYMIAYPDTYHTRLVKLDKTGNPEWAREIIINTLSPDIVGVRTTSDSGCTLCLVSREFSQQNKIIAMKFSRTGETIWQTVDSNISALVSPSGFTPTFDGGFTICGGVFNQLSSGNIYAAKYDALGKKEWSTVINLFGEQNGTGITELSNGDFALVADYSVSGQGTLTSSDGTLVIAILDRKGGSKSIQKLNLLPNSSTNATAVVATRDDGFAIIGTMTKYPVNRSKGQPYPPTALLFIKSANENTAQCHFQNTLLSTEPAEVIGIKPLLKITSIDDTVYFPRKNTLMTTDFQVYDVCSLFSVQSMEQDAQAITISPNPVQSGKQATLHCGGNLSVGKYQLRIYNLSGNTDFKEKIDLSGNTQDIPIDITGLAPGMYILELQNESGSVYRTKFVKEE